MICRKTILPKLSERPIFLFKYQIFFNKTSVQILGSNISENALNLNSIITISQNNSHVTIQIPDSLNVSNLVASFIRPNDNLLDKDFKIGGTNTFLIDKKELKKGLYNIELRFKNDDIDCLQKSTLYL